MIRLILFSVLCLSSFAHAQGVVDKWEADWSNHILIAAKISSARQIEYFPGGFNEDGSFDFSSAEFELAFRDVEVIRGASEDVIDKIRIELREELRLVNKRIYLLLARGDSGWNVVSFGFPTEMVCVDRRVIEGTPIEDSFALYYNERCVGYEYGR